MKQNFHTLHLISHTHWDREWYRTFQQFRIKLVLLVDHLLAILDQDPNYQHFMLDGQTIVLEDYLEVRPERAGDLLRYIQNGRIIIGPWFILPDEFLVSPESTIRNLLEGDRICKQVGPKMNVGYIPDPFGHIGQMPQILSGFGIASACVMRGLADEPCEFVWQSPNGSRVLMAYLKSGYGNAAGILSGNLDAFRNEAVRLRDELLPYSATTHILLMHGVDHMEPQGRTSEAVDYANQMLEGDCILHSTLSNYIAAVQTTVDIASLPVVRGELRTSKKFPLLPAVLSTRMWIKQMNHACETLLENWAEPFSTWMTWIIQQDQPANFLSHPESLLHQAWRLLMLCHPHDSICGCSIDQVHNEMKPRFEQTQQIAEEITNHSLSALVECIDTSTRSDAVISSVVVFNPSSVTRTGLVDAVLEGLPETGGFHLIDEDGGMIQYYAKGMGSSEIINMKMNRKELRDGFGMVSDGLVMGMGIIGFTTQTQGSSVSIHLILSEKGEPNLSQWEKGKREVEIYLEDDAFTEFHVVANGAAAAQVSLLAHNVPGLGYRTYWVVADAAEIHSPAKINPAVSYFLPLIQKIIAVPGAKEWLAKLNPDPSKKIPHRIENEFFVVEAKKDGTVDILDKRSGISYTGQNRFLDGGDRGDEYNYSPPMSDLIQSVHMKFTRVERTPVHETLIIHLDLTIPISLAPDRKSRDTKRQTISIVSKVVLTHHVARVDFSTEIDNQCLDHRLRVHFAAPFSVTAAEYDGHFELVQRPVGVPPFDHTWVEAPRPEVPQRAFTHISENGSGLVLANRGLPEVEVRNGQNGTGEIALTLLRCVGWLSRDDFPERKGHAGPFMETPEAQMIGKWQFDYSFIPYGNQARLEAFHLAYAFQSSLRSSSTTIHSGKLPGNGSFVQSSTPEFKISAVKTAQDGRGWLVRGYNLSAQDIQVSLKTILPVQAAEIVNLAEKTIGKLDISEQCTVVFHVSGKEVVSILFQ